MRYYIKGKSFVGDNLNKKILPHSTIKLLSEANEKLQTTTSDSSGNFLFAELIEIGKTYHIFGEKEGFIHAEVRFPTAGKEADQADLLDLPVDTASVELSTEVILQENIFIALEKGGEIELQGITYEFDKWDITEEAKIELDKLVNYMKENTVIAVELGSHTDSRGTVRYNSRLSQKRSRSAVAYIISEGVDTSRIIARGLRKNGFENP